MTFDDFERRLKNANSGIRLQKLESVMSGTPEFDLWYKLYMEQPHIQVTQDSEHFFTFYIIKKGDENIELQTTGKTSKGKTRAV